MKNFKAWAFLTSFLALALIFLEVRYRVVFKREFSSYWQGREQARLPASELKNKLEKHLNHQLLADFFTPNDFAKLVSYEVRPRFWTDQNEEFIKERTQKVINEAITSTLTQKHSGDLEVPLASALRENATSAFIKNFIRTIRVHNLINATFQFDLFFTPKLHRNLNFKPELKSNQLIQLDDVGELADFLSQEEVGQIDQILNTNLPHEGERQYHGGSITLWLKVLDLAWNPLSPIPHPKKNAIKGFVRFRKYLRVNRKRSLESSKGPVELLHIASSDEGGPIFYTLDLIKTFNLQELTPKLDRLEVYPGLLVPNNLHKGSALRRLFSRSEKSRSTGTYKAYGEIKNNSFNAKLKKLVYSYEKKQWLRDSQIDIDFQSALLEEEQGLIHSQAKDAILKDSSHLFIQALDLKGYLEMGERE